MTSKLSSYMPVKKVPPKLRQDIRPPSPMHTPEGETSTGFIKLLNQAKNTPKHSIIGQRVREPENFEVYTVLQRKQSPKGAMIQVEWTTTEHEFLKGKAVKDIEVKHQDWFWEDEVEIVVDKPEFAIGDYVMQQDGKIRGTIEKMKKPKKLGAGFNYRVGDAWVNETLLTLSAKPKNAKEKAIIKFTAGNSNCQSFGPEINGEPTRPADMTAVSKMQIAYQLFATDLEKNLFCLTSTDIYVHDHISHKKPPSYRGKTPKEKVSPQGLKYGSTGVAIVDGKWYFEADFEHCDHDELKENARIMRSILEKFLKTNLKRFHPYHIHKDYDYGVYIYTSQRQTHEPREVDGVRIMQGDTERFRQYEFPVQVYYRDKADKQNSWQPWENLDSYNPPDPEWMTPAAKNLYGHTREEIHAHCPVCANRKYLESLEELKPEVTGNEIYDRRLASGYESRKGEEETFSLNWLLLKNKFEAKHTPKCKVCKNLIQTGVIFGCDSWVRRVKSGLCDEHDPEVRRRHEEFMRKWNAGTEKHKTPTASTAAEKTGLLDAFFGKK